MEVGLLVDGWRKGGSTMEEEVVIHGEVWTGMGGSSVVDCFLAACC
jgi:hypothetical protein